MEKRENITLLFRGIVINAAEKKAEEKAKRNSVVGGQQLQTREGPTTV
ncbi:8692_t:CDS:2 [Entrophospora sp. SA101]|nr:8692_t:CDS:2 [Entrophospora sp. SA101]